MTGAASLARVDLELTPNEASDLLPLDDAALLAAHGWDAAYLTVLDEGPVERCIAVLGHSTGDAVDRGWTSRRLIFSPVSGSGSTADAESLAVHEGRVHVVGSHFGPKGGPVLPDRQFVARFAMADLAAAVDGARPGLEIARTAFTLHRAVNDALARAVDLLPLAPRAREAFVGAARRRGVERNEPWRHHLHPGDQPINVEGAAFGPEGRLVLGLRFPPTADGHALLVEVDEAGTLFAGPGAMPRCVAVWVLGGPGGPGAPVGVRALHHAGDGLFDVVTGCLDERGAPLLGGRDEGARAGCAHWRFRLPAGAAGGTLSASLVHDFGGLDHVEGVASGPDGAPLYVVDADGEVDLRFLRTGSASRSAGPTRAG
jgi:hypothetical protein